MFEGLMRQITMMKEIAVEGIRSAESIEKWEENMIHECYKTFDKGYLDIVQLRTLLEKI
jgi:hypothetical protein